MWFRALRPYRLPNRLGIDAEELERRLQSRTFSACTPAQASSLGWVPALDDAASALVHAAGPYWMVRLKREEKLLPATVVREQANERCTQIAKAQGRKVSRRERLAVIDEVTQDLLPRASHAPARFARSSLTRLGGSGSTAVALGVRKRCSTICVKHWVICPPCCPKPKKPRPT